MEGTRKRRIHVESKDSGEKAAKECSKRSGEIIKRALLCLHTFFLLRIINKQSIEE